jgi:hypothetical protein
VVGAISVLGQASAGLVAKRAAPPTGYISNRPKFVLESRGAEG